MYAVRAVQARWLNISLASVVGLRWGNAHLWKVCDIVVLCRNVSAMLILHVISWNQLAVSVPCRFAMLVSLPT